MHGWGKTHDAARGSGVLSAPSPTHPTPPFSFLPGTEDHSGYHPERQNASRLYNTRYLDFTQRLLGNVTDRARRHNIPEVRCTKAPRFPADATMPPRATHTWPIPRYG